MNKVSFYACEAYEDRSALRRALLGIIEDIGGFASLLSRGKRVVIKPNLVMKKSPEGAATTHPAVLEELILLLKEHTEDISVAECPGGPGTEVLLESIYRTTGIRAVCERQSVPILSGQEAVSVSTPDGFAAGELLLSRAMVQAPVFINVGKLKSHSLTTFTGCAKNLYGAVPGLTKVEYHARFAELSSFCELICDINRTLVPSLSILDAIVGMEGNGPTGGEPRAIGGLIGGVSTFAVDTLGAQLIGLNPAETPILKAAASHGLIPEEIEYVGDDWRMYVKSDFRLADAQRFSILNKMPELKLLRRFLEPRPVISERCVGCGECVRLCPAHTIELRTSAGKKRARIQAKKCIRCYCCQELCPAKAVDTRSRRILKL